MILYGKVVRDSILTSLKEDFSKLPFVANLVILQVGDRFDSSQYIEQKKKIGETLGVKILHEKLPESISKNDLLKKISEYNNDKSVHGIIAQFPLPGHIDPSIMMDAIFYKKDVDGLNSKNKELFDAGDITGIVPATARGVLSLLKYYKIGLQDKNVAVIGRSRLVGTPIADACRREGAIVTVCHRSTPDIPSITKKSDIIVSATGVPRLITVDYVSKGQIVIDVGINIVKGGHLEEEIKGKKIVGDVAFEEVKDVVDAISPVPGGVGPMTVVSLFQNLLDVCKMYNK